ncbi:UV radiation resistance-associated gene protein-like isoform X1 [Zingiber officinale]|uniref:UV radiation resistance-associated gene protein-like isoform X1 n=1 Tax=Zingiber officinale TaxID=94328 RepID=UPI001C4BFB55|nr:UV radiation resistance-associated gene protein-like isoform X1 [Zingiber officinale]
MESDRPREPDLATGTELSEWAVCDAQEIEGGDDPKIVDWEDLQQELARLWSLSSALKKAKERKESLSQRLESFIEARKGSLRQTNELEEMKDKLESKRLALENLSMHIKQTSENSQKERDKLCHSTRVLLVAGKRLTASHQQLQEASKLLSGERGYDNLKKLQKLLRLRQGDMVTQISTLYSIKSASEQPFTEATDPHTIGTSSRGSTSPSSPSKPLHLSSLTILGLQLTMLPIKTMGYFSDKKEVQMFASALGYVAHAVSLISSYLYVPLRYPLHFKGSRSYIYDHTSTVDNAASDLMGNSASLSTSSKPIDFPLFLDGQDTTRAAYAIFLLNKNLEQLLNYIGAESLGPRHILPNLKELMQIILSKEYLNM